MLRLSEKFEGLRASMLMLRQLLLHDVIKLVPAVIRFGQDNAFRGIEIPVKFFRCLVPENNIDSSR